MTEQKILIVEDELLIARDLSQKLKEIGYQIVAIVSSGQAALNVIDKNPPDLVLMDIVIKGDRDGIDTTQVINEKFGIPVI
ncbi:MAG: response regulator, partial [Pseudanabaena sp.]